MGLDRRGLLRAGSGVGVGITTLALPSAAQAASFAGTTLATVGPSTLTVDDTGTAAAGHDLTLRIRLLGATGAPEDGNFRVDLTVRIDDGSTDGTGTLATGTRIDGVTRSTHAVLVDTGEADIAIDLPAAGTYLFAVTTTPAPTSQPGGVVLAYEFAG